MSQKNKPSSSSFQRNRGPIGSGLAQRRPFAAGILILSAVLLAACSKGAEAPAATESAQGTTLPVNQVVTPMGRQLELPKMRPQALALSPDGRILVVSGKTAELVAVDPATGGIRQRVLLPPDPPDGTKPPAPSENILKPDDKGQVSYTGLAFSPDGRRLYMSNVNGSIKVFDVGPDGVITGLVSIPLPPAGAPRR